MGALLAKRMAMTELPQMVAGFHSLVGLAAVATSIASYMAHPEAGDAVHLVSTFAGTFIGAVTLTGMPMGTFVKTVYAGFLNMPAVLELCCCM